MRRYELDVTIPRPFRAGEAGRWAAAVADLVNGASADDGLASVAQSAEDSLSVCVSVPDELDDETASVLRGAVTDAVSFLLEEWEAAAVGRFSPSAPDARPSP